MHPATSFVPSSRVVRLEGHCKHQNLLPTLKLVSLAGSSLQYPSLQGSHSNDTLFSSIPSVQSAVKSKYLQLFDCFHFQGFDGFFFRFLRFLLSQIQQHLFITYVKAKIHNLSKITNNYKSKLQSKDGRLYVMLSAVAVLNSIKMQV